MAVAGAAQLRAADLPAVARRATAVDDRPASRHLAVVEVHAERVALSRRSRADAAARIIPADFVTFNGHAIDGASVVLARDVLPLAFRPRAHAGAVHGSDLGDVVLVLDEFVGVHLAERLGGRNVGVEDRLAVDAGAHHLEVLEVTVAVLGTVGQLDVVDVQDELVVAIEVTDGDVLLAGVGAQVNAVVVPVALGAGLTVAAGAHHVAAALGRHRPFVHHRPVARAVARNGNAEVVGRIAGILGACPEAEGATGSQGHLRRNEVVVGIQDLARTVGPRT